MPERSRRQAHVRRPPAGRYPAPPPSARFRHLCTPRALVHLPPPLSPILSTKSSQVCCLITHFSSHPTPSWSCSQIATLGEADFFGERALFSNEPRAASVRAMTRLELVRLSKAAFDALILPLQKQLEQEAREKEEAARQREVRRRTSARTELCN